MYTVRDTDVSSFVGFVISLIFITGAHGLAHPSPSPAIIFPLSSTSSTLQLLNSSSTDKDVKFVNTTNNLVRCEGKRYGYDLNQASCEDAWKKMPTDPHFFTYGARGKGFFERPLPYRYLSGKCSASKFGFAIFSLLLNFSGLR